MTDVEYRLLRGWSKQEVAERLRRAQGLALNYDASPAEMTRENGWSQVESQAVIARERPGPPSGDDGFARLRHALVHMGFSDPRIVRGHFDASGPLQGRVVLLELRPVGPRYLCAVRVSAVREGVEDGRTVFGYCFDTLEGHIEAGREWFLLSKDHASGELRFHIKASWHPGSFPNWWSRVGFELLGRRYQRAWHHLAHLRLRELLLTGRLEHSPALEALLHEGLEVERHPVQFYSSRGLGRRLGGVEREVEVVRRDRLLTGVALGALAGLRSLSAPVLVSHRLAREPEHAPLGPARLLASRRAWKGLAVLALGEWVADKLPGMPSRVEPLPLVGRALSGALCASAVAACGRHPRLGRALLGGVVAVASAVGAWWARRAVTRRLRVPDVAAAVVEDALVLALGAEVASALRPGVPGPD